MLRVDTSRHLVLVQFLQTHKYHLVSSGAHTPSTRQPDWKLLMSRRTDGTKRWWVMVHKQVWSRRMMAWHPAGAGNVGTGYMGRCLDSTQRER